MFGRKKKKPEEPDLPPPPPMDPVAPSAREPAYASPPAPPAPVSVPQASPSVPAQTPAPSAAASSSNTVTPDYGSATTLAANHIIVNAGQGRIVLDIASELTNNEQGGKTLPVTSRVVMTAQTGDKLKKALEQALLKLQQG